MRNVTIDFCRGIGVNRWAVRLNVDQALSKNDMLFHRERLPSSRDDEYFAEFRFDTKEDAFRTWCEWRKKYGNFENYYSQINDND